MARSKYQRTLMLTRSHPLRSDCHHSYVLSRSSLSVVLLSTQVSQVNTKSLPTLKNGTTRRLFQLLSQPRPLIVLTQITRLTPLKVLPLSSHAFLTTVFSPVTHILP